MLHLLLCVLGNGLLLGELRRHRVTHLLLWLLHRLIWLLLLSRRHLLDFLVLHRRISHSCCSRRDILILSPLFDLIISPFDELVSEVEKNSLGAFLGNLPSDALQRVAVHIHLLNRLMVSEPMRQSYAIVIDHGKSGHLWQVESKRNRDLCDTIVSNVDDFKFGELGPAKLLNIRQLVHVQV